MKRDRSIARVRSSSSSFAKILGKAIIEGYSDRKLLYAAISTLVGHAKEFFLDRAFERLERFHRMLIDRTQEYDLNDLFEKEFEEDDYYKLLSSVISDDEDEKVEIYSKIFGYLKIGLIPKDYRRYLIKMAKSLTTDDFEVLRRIYISNRYEFTDDGDTTNQVTDITNSSNPETQISIRALIQQGLLLDQKNIGPIITSDRLPLVAKWIYDPECLTPDTIGKKSQNNVDVVIVAEKVEIDNIIIKELSKYLSENGVSSIMAVRGKFKNIIESSKCLVLIYGIQASGEMLKYCSRMKGGKVPIIQAQLSQRGSVVVTKLSVKCTQLLEKSDYKVLLDEINSAIGAT